MASSRAKRTSIRSRVANSAASTSKSSSAGDPSLSLFSSKRDKRAIKHTSFVSKIEKSHAKKQKRRRPSKKLVANLESLADALPGAGGNDGVEGAVVGDAWIRHKSLKSRPGASKRKGKVERMERERFSRNLAQMVGMAAEPPKERETPNVGLSQEQATSPTSTWAALRGFVSQTMDRKADFD